MSASGLVYKHYGKEIIRSALDELLESKTIPENVKSLLTDEEVERIWLSSYKFFFITLDAIDNGIDRYPKDVKPKYNYYKTDLASRVGRLNPQWWDEECDFDGQFRVAMGLCKDEFLHNLKTEVMSGVASIPIVNAAYEEGLKGDGQILILKRSCYWKEALFTIEK